MPVFLSHFIITYGYIAIFGLVFLQEIGVPNPIPNELVLLFAGYLTYIHTLSFTFTFVVVVSADSVGTTLLYAVFYRAGPAIIAKFPHLLSHKNIDRLSKRIVEKNRWSIYLGRLLPYVRGYTSVAAGLLRIGPELFIPAVFFSAITWSGGYVIAGRLAGPAWSTIAAKVGTGELVFLLIAVIILSIVGGPRLYRYLQKHKDTVDRSSKP